jgi:hypothetical protein
VAGLENIGSLHIRAGSLILPARSVKGQLLPHVSRRLVDRSAPEAAINEEPSECVKEEKSAMDTPNIVVPRGRDPVSPGRSFSLKLRGGETGDSIMLFNSIGRERLLAGRRQNGSDP